MAYSGWSTTNYIESTTGVITATPVTMCCWVNTTSLAAVQTPIGIYRSSSAPDTNSFELSIGTGGALSAKTSGASATTTTGAITTNTWAHVCGVFTSATSRAAFINGANKATNATSSTPTGLNRLSIGVERGGFGSGEAFSGAIAEAAYWNAALTDDEVAALGKGFSPRLIRPSALVAYLPLIRDFVDVKGAGFSVTGSLTVADHCAIRG